MSTITMKKCDRCGAMFDLIEHESNAKSLSERHPLYKVKVVIALGVGMGEREFEKEVCKPCRLLITDSIREALHP